MSTTVAQWSRPEIKQFVNRAKEIYRSRLAEILEPEHNGEIVAIAPDTEEYFIGADEIQAVEVARAAGNEGPFYFLRVGSDYTHRWMTPRR